jgi:hypothetical protein
MTDKHPIEIRDESTDAEQRFQLYVDGQRRALLTLNNRGTGRLPQFHWEVYGPQVWPEAKALLAGLLELSLIADELLWRIENGGKKESGKR